MHSACGILGQETPAAPRMIRLYEYCQTIRMSRDPMGTEAFAGLIPFLARWCVEVSLRINHHVIEPMLASGLG